MLDGFRRGGNLPPALALSKSGVSLTGSKIVAITFDVCAVFRIGACTQPPESPLKGGQGATVDGKAGRRGIVPARTPLCSPWKGGFGGRQVAAPTPCDAGEVV